MRLSALNAWSKNRSFPSASFGDARTIIVGVLGLLLVTFAVFQQTDPEAAVFRLLRDLPPEVQMVLLASPTAQPSRLFSRDSSSAKELVLSLLNLPPVRIPPELPTLATLVIEDPAGNEQSVVLVEQSVVHRFGLRGVEVGGLVALGEGSHLLAARSREMRTVSPTLLRELRTAPGVRVLVHPGWFLRRFPALPQPNGQELMALWVQGDSRHLRTEGMFPRGRETFISNGKRFLATRPDNALLVLDGIPASALFPSELPPLLEALRAETGVGPEVRALTEVLRDTPVFLVIQAQPEGLPTITAGMAPAEEHRERVEAAVRALLVRRLAIAQAAIETVRANGRTIRHARPSSQPGELEETHDGPWRILRAPKAAGAHDLVAGFRDGVVLLGTSAGSLREIGAALRSADARDSTTQFFLDGALLRRDPAVAFALRGLSPELRSWANLLERLVIEVSSESRNFRFLVEVDWSPP
ncbi:MAG: hypothetical protein Q8R32_02775 [bacterium]|nr:hypothetical protein [bacterium]